MKHKAIFLDRDGVLVEEYGHLHKIEKCVFVQGMFDALKKAQDTFRLIIVTNQGGIAKGMYSLADYYEVTTYILRECEKRGVEITDVFQCPCHPEGDVKRYKLVSPSRKPGTGMLRHAAEHYDIDLKGSWMIGDKMSDIQAGHDAGCKTILVRTGQKDKKDAKTTAMPDHTVEDIKEAIKVIIP